MSFQQSDKHRSDKPTVTVGRGNKFGFSQCFLTQFNPDGHDRVSVFTDTETRRVGFFFSPDADLKINEMKQIRCDRVFRDLGMEGDGTRYVATAAEEPEEEGERVDCFITIPKKETTE